MIHKIKELCKAQGLTITELEKKIGIAPKSIYKWDTQSPSVDKVYRVAKVLGTTVEELLKAD